MKTDSKSAERLKRKKIENTKAISLYSYSLLHGVRTKPPSEKAPPPETYWTVIADDCWFKFILLGLCLFLCIRRPCCNGGIKFLPCPSTLLSAQVLSRVIGHVRCDFSLTQSPSLLKLHCSTECGTFPRTFPPWTILPGQSPPHYRNVGQFPSKQFPLHKEI